jgi:3,4-dihydroxy 2-butanone 4-phosphate synthase/GTP cyclohydrolase II
MPINRVLKAIEEIKKGKMVIMMDDEDRENEGDLIYASTFSTAEHVNFMATYGKGLICVALDTATADRLNLNYMVEKNNSSYETAFTVSVDDKNAKTGISAYERNNTIQILANPISSKDDLVRPGHIFPLIAKDGGVLERTGHTEGSVDLCKLAGISPSAVICEIMKDDGTMARADDLEIFAKENDLHIVYISDLVEYRLKHEKIVQLISKEETTFMDSQVEKFEYQDHLNNKHTVFAFGDISQSSFVKFHNVTSDLDTLSNSEKFNSLMNSIKLLKENSGVIIFLGSDNRNDIIKDFGVGAGILNDLGIKNIKLISKSKNHEFVGISGFGLTIEEVTGI